MTGPRVGANWTVLVTGANSGLGRCLALELAALGCRLILTGRNASRLEAVATEVQSAGASAAWFSVDLASAQGVDQLLDEVSVLGWPVDALVNNAGFGLSGAWAEGSREDDRRLVGLLVEAPLALTRAFLGNWRHRGRGAVLNVASTGAFQPGPQTSVYYAAKAFLMSWSVALGHEEGTWLAVTTFCPGAMRTTFASNAGKANIPGAPGPERYAKIAISAWKKNRGLVVPGWSNRLLVFLSRLAPVSVTAAVVDRIQRSVRKA